MQQKMNELRERFTAELKAVADLDALKVFHGAWLGRKGEVQKLFLLMKDADPAERPKLGQQLNVLKQELNASFNEVQDQLKRSQSVTRLDLSLPGHPAVRGRLHPLEQMRQGIISVFTRMGFTVEDGPEVETERYNFDMLNTPFWHPARAEEDSLYLEQGHMLRTETSPVQVRVMQRVKPPLRIIAPGRVYRNDKPDATHSPMFMQVEGLCVDKGISFADLKGTLLEFYRQIFGAETQLRFRPHYFPFTTPSAEVDVTCIFCKGKGCRVCKQTGWLEMGGSGMVHPNVLRGVEIDPAEYSGFAFGLGIERMAMLLYEVDDIRLFYENDLRFLKQF